MKSEEVVARMCESGVLPVFRTTEVRHLLDASGAYRDAGIACVAYTMTMPGVPQLVSQAVERFGDSLLIGAGTVLDGKTVDDAVRAGAAFIASPGISPEMISACRRHGVPSVVGAVTPSEIMRALELGADVIKVFPACSVGPRFFAEVLGPFPKLCLMAAGGVNLQNVGEYIGVGAQIVTVLANALDAEAYRTGDCPPITSAARGLVQAVQRARERH